MRKAKYYHTTGGEHEIVTWLAWSLAQNSGGGMYPVAIVEKQNGKVVCVGVDKIQFCEPLKEQL